jgi:hypothetical protein
MIAIAYQPHQYGPTLRNYNTVNNVFWLKNKGTPHSPLLAKAGSRATSQRVEVPSIYAGHFAIICIIMPIFY